MERTVEQRLTRIRQMASFIEQEAKSQQWDSALARAVTLHNDAAFIVDWLRGQAEFHFVATSGTADNWETTAEPLGNVTESLSGTLDADLPVLR